MKIGLWTDSIHFPNLAQLKLSAYHKRLGDTVEYVTEGGHYDKVYLSKVFNLPHLKTIPTAPPLFYADEVEKGGTGYAIVVKENREQFHPELHKNLPQEIETIFPDYSIVPDEWKDTAFGFLTRGCCNNCSFCIVSPKEGRMSHKVANLEDFWNRQKNIELMDPNLLACKDSPELIQQLIDSKAKVNFNQGLDARFMTKDVAELISQIPIKKIHFAFDFMKNEAAIIKGLRTFRPYYKKSSRELTVYVLTNYNTTNEEDWYRVKQIIDADYSPYIMIYQKGTHNQFITDLARWCNSQFLFRSTSFEDYVPRKDGKSCKVLYPFILNNPSFIIPTKHEMVCNQNFTQNTKTNKIMEDNMSNNIYQKLQQARDKFLQTAIKKSGVNMHAEFEYFELEDIVPTAQRIFSELNLVFVTTFLDGKACGTLVNTDSPTDQLSVSFPIKSIGEPAKFRMNEVQALGAEITYMRRYLYMLILDIVEHDKLDPISGEEAPEEKKPEPKKPATKEERKEIQTKLTNVDAPADEVQVEGIRKALRNLVDKDESQEEKVNTIMVQTQDLQKITKAEAEKLMAKLTKALSAYEVQK